MSDYYDDSPRRGNSDGGGGGIAVMLIVIALLFIGVPLLLPTFVKAVHIGGLAQALIAGFGVLMLIAGSVMGAISAFYQKAGSNEAFVRTGMGGPVVVLDGGAIVVPAIHKVRKVSLETSKLVVERAGKDALITADNLRVDVRAEFYIKVKRTTEGVTAAATSLGDKSYNDQKIMELVGEKLISAMRTVAARSDLQHLHSKLDEYRNDVKNIVEHDLEPNGLELETVAISHLNQTSPDHLDPENNVFDAQGAKKIAEIVNQQRIERSQITTEADRKVKAQEVDRDKQLFDLDVMRESAQATTSLSVQKARAQATREGAEFAAEQDRLSQVARVSAEQAVEIARVEKTQAVEVASAAQERAVQTANIEKTQAVEVRNREQAIAVAEKDTERAQAETRRVAAETERTRAEQGRLTVEAQATAERNKGVAVINKEAVAQQTKIERQMEADVAAYGVVAQANAAKDAATANADATIKAADADKQADELRASGKKALELVPVQVALEQVQVNLKQVEVDATALENQEKFSRAAIDLQVRLAEINANRDARIEAAKAIGAAIAAADLKIYGDPTALQSILGSVYKAQGIGEFVGELPGEVKTLATNTLEGFANLASAAVKRVMGHDIPPETIKRMVSDELATRGGVTATPSAEVAAK